VTAPSVAATAAAAGAAAGAGSAAGGGMDGDGDVAAVADRAAVAGKARKAPALLVEHNAIAGGEQAYHPRCEKAGVVGRIRRGR
jgi:hypothetical protein